jgi:hypothetical protein
MKQVASPATYKVGVHTTSHVHCNDTDNDWPLKLLGIRKYNRRDIGEHFKQVLKSCFNGGKGAAVVGFNFLNRRSTMLQEMSSQ